MIFVSQVDPIALRSGAQLAGGDGSCAAASPRTTATQRSPGASGSPSRRFAVLTLVYFS